MENSKKDISVEILYKKMNHALSAGEEKSFEEWIREPEHAIYYEHLKVYWEIPEKRELSEKELNGEWQRIQRGIRPQKSFRRKLFRYVAVAASMVLAIGLIGLLYIKKEKQQPEEFQVIQIRPGQRNAVLEMANGRVYNLKDMGQRGHSKIAENIIVDSCRLDYIRPDTLYSAVLAYNKLIVPRGGEFQLSLEDGTKVWLNSESTLKYPEVFVGKTREVYLEGEAYFEVAKNTDRPFVVHSGIQDIRVLGTSFCITNYADDQNLTTTLVSGKVEVGFPGFSDEVFFLEPGFQLACERQSRKIRKRMVDINEYVAWKDGKYVFTQKRLEDMLATLARWYDFQIFYQNQSAKEVLFSGELMRFENFNDILRMIGKSSDVKFSVKGHIVTVSQ